MNKKATQADIQKSSAKLRRLITFLLTALAATLVLERFGAVGIQLFRQSGGTDTLSRLAFECITACPEVLYLIALWWIRQALSAFAEGELYAPTVARMLDRVGIMLAAGAFISVFLVPSATRAIGFAPGYMIAFDVSGLVLGAVGLSLKVIAHVLRRAAEMQAELDEIF
jgi:Protein of unknown function (DUF2975)